MTLRSNQSVPVLYWLSAMTSAGSMHVDFLLENGQCSNNNDNDRINVSAYTTGVGERAHARTNIPP